MSGLDFVPSTVLPAESAEYKAVLQGEGNRDVGENCLFRELSHSLWCWRLPSHVLS